MPCTCEGYDNPDSISLWRERADVATQRLCAACHALDSAGQLYLLPRDTQDWYTDHKRKDREREAREAVDHAQRLADLRTQLESIERKGRK